MKSLNKRNPIFMMSDSGARGNASNFTQLAGMRGLMVIHLVVSSNFNQIKFP